VARKEAPPNVRDKSLDRNVAWQSFDEGSMVDSRESGRVHTIRAQWTWWISVSLFVKSLDCGTCGR